MRPVINWFAHLDADEDVEGVSVAGVGEGDDVGDGDEDEEDDGEVAGRGGGRRGRQWTVTRDEAAFLRRFNAQVSILMI